MRTSSSESSPILHRFIAAFGRKILFKFPLTITPTMEDLRPYDGNPWADWVESMSLEDQPSTGSAHESQLPKPETAARKDNSSDEDDSEFDFALYDGLCQDCRKNPGEWYCGACTQRYCENCWKRRPGHKKKNPDSANHMKVSYANQ